MPSSRTRLSLHSCAATLVLGFLSSAQDARQEPDGSAWIRKGWSTENGLPQNTVNAVLQTCDGYLWIATFGGLGRFDGQRLHVYDTGNSPELRDNRILALHEGPEGLWIGTESAGLFRRVEGRFESVLDTGGEGVRALVQDAQGRLVLSVGDRVEIREPTSLHLLEEHALLRNWDLLLSRSGALYAAGQHGLARLRDGSVERLSREPLSCLAETGSGLLLAGGKSLWFLDGDQLRGWRPAGALSFPIRTLFAASDGALWVGMQSSVLRLPLAASPEPSLAGIETPFFLARPVRCFGEDDAGGVWIGSEGSGLVSLRPAELQCFGPNAGLPESGINSVLADEDGGVLVGTNAGLFHGRPGAFAAVGAAARIRYVHALARDSDGSLWIGGGEKVMHLWKDGGSRVFGAAQGLPQGAVRAILRDSRGELWLGTEDGVRWLRGEALESPHSPAGLAAELDGEAVKLLVETHDGALWIGSTRRLVRLDRERETFQSWRAGAGLPYGEVRAVLPAADGRTWIGIYGAGFCRLGGEGVVSVDERHGLFDNSICAVTPLADQLAVGGNKGSFLVSMAELEAVADGRQAVLACRPLLGPSGVASEASGGVQPSACVSAGRAWFCGLAGLLSYASEERAPRAPAPRCQVEEAIAGEAAWTDPTELETPRGVRTVAFRLTGCDFVHPAQLRFRWRLRGLSDTWSEPSYAREARFELPAPGEYDFEAAAIDGAHHASVVPARVHVSVPALPWERGGFRVAALALLLVAAVLLVRFGAHRSAVRAARLQSTVDERTRELRAARETLEERVRARTEELQHALQQLQDDHAKRQVLEQEIQQLQRMESLGQLAGGVAHDFNNLLTVVLGSGALLQRELAEQPRLATLAASICDAGDRGRRLTQHLLALASRQVVVPEVLDLCSLVSDLVTVLRRLVGDKVVLTFTAEAGPVHLRAAASQIEQILINLCVNARDAMPNGGQLEIRVVRSAEQVGLVVRDTGTGMSPEVSARALEPFFTTKAAGQGTGLGLSTVYGIAKQLGGEVRFESQLGRGTTFTIWLPCVGSPAQESHTLTPAPRPARASGTVLLIEDQQVVRLALRMMLERMGCAVREAESGVDAVHQIRTAPDDIDVVLSDVLMPGLRGMALVEALRSLRSDLPIVFLSGYVDDRGTYRELLDAGLEIVAKPPESAELAAALQRARRQGGARSPAPSSMPQ